MNQSLQIYICVHVYLFSELVHDNKIRADLYVSGY